MKYMNLISHSTEELVEANNGFGLQVASDIDERNRLWKARHEMVYACTALIPGSRVLYMISFYKDNSGICVKESSLV